MFRDAVGNASPTLKRINKNVARGVPTAPLLLAQLLSGLGFRSLGCMSYMYTLPYTIHIYILYTHNMCIYIYTYTYLCKHRHTYTQTRISQIPETVALKPLARRHPAAAVWSLAPCLLGRMRGSFRIWGSLSVLRGFISSITRFWW